MKNSGTRLSFSFFRNINNDVDDDEDDDDDGDDDDNNREIGKVNKTSPTSHRRA